MTREEAIGLIKPIMFMMKNPQGEVWSDAYYALEMAIKALEQEPCSNCIEFKRYAKQMGFEIEEEPKQGHCKDCKWWKDSDGSYRRGVSAESICPINTKTVLDGKGYCYLFSKNE